MDNFWNTNFTDWLVDWLMVFYAQAAIFHLYSGDEHEMDDKMNMKLWWNENGMGHKDK